MTHAGPAADAASVTHLPLLADGSLRLEVGPGLLSLVRRWLPLIPYDQTPVVPDAAVMRLVRGDPPSIPAPAGKPVVRLGAADAWVDDAADTAVLRCTAGSAARLDLAGRTVEIVVRADAAADDAEVAWDAFSACTVSCALLLGCMHRALVHAAAIVAPGGGAWLITGDTHAGKSTTTVNLIEAGWRFVTDDHGVLARGADGGLTVEGWPRRFHLDEGWESGAPVHRRGEIDPHQRWPGRWQRTAPLAGLLFPRVDAHLPTVLEPLPPADALAALMRQSPWLLADRRRAPEILGFLRSACERPAYALRLGLDTYRDTARLLDVLAPLSSAD